KIYSHMVTLWGNYEGISQCNALIVDNYNGFVVERSNVSKLADKISLLITNPDERDRMGKNARQNIEERFTSTLVIEQTLKVYQEIYNK
ncbi:glycosyltransferase, partial [Klebsiella aerogenes]|uniref:glycosyltransferase n=1 Tax=Klebsiella aerogenes TaxID=548 RepID=UPI0005746DB9